MSETVEKSGKQGSEEKSLLLEIISLILLVGIIYFLVKGGLVLGFRTPSPMMGVSSGSMDHADGSWKDYYVEKGYEVSEFPFQNGLQKGDLVFVRGVNSIEDIERGDVVVFWWGRGGQRKRIIHRVAEINEDKGTISTKGDANLVLERDIYIKNVIAKAVTSVPYLGYPSLGV